MSKREYNKRLAERLYGKRPKATKVRPIEAVWREEEPLSHLVW